MQYALIPLCFGLMTGAVGKYKRSSFFIWFLVGAIVPVIGLVAVVMSRSERFDPLRECPSCHNVLPIAAQVCPRCGEDLDYPDELIAPRGYEFAELEEAGDARE